MIESSPEISDDGLAEGVSLGGVFAPAVAQSWTREVAAAKVEAAREAAKVAHEAAEALRGLGSGEDFRAAKKSLLEAVRHLRRAFKAIRQSFHQNLEQ